MHTHKHPDKDDEPARSACSKMTCSSNCSLQEQKGKTGTQNGQEAHPPHLPNSWLLNTLFLTSTTQVIYAPLNFASSQQIPPEGILSDTFTVLCFHLAQVSEPRSKKRERGSYLPILLLPPPYPSSKGFASAPLLPKDSRT